MTQIQPDASKMFFYPDRPSINSKQRKILKSIFTMKNVDREGEATALNIFELILTNEKVGRESEANEAPAELLPPANTLTIARERLTAAHEGSAGASPSRIRKHTQERCLERWPRSRYPSRRNRAPFLPVSQVMDCVFYVFNVGRVARFGVELLLGEAARSIKIVFRV